MGIRRKPFNWIHRNSTVNYGRPRSRDRTLSVTMPPFLVRGLIWIWVKEGAVEELRVKGVSILTYRRKPRTVLQITLLPVVHGSVPPTGDIGTSTRTTFYFSDTIPCLRLG